MATYPGMTLGGEIRESISLDDDDLSDVEDEVFIRDGKNGYKFAEDVGVKRPLMAPRRKLNKSDSDMRFKTRHLCRFRCKPCCYFLAAFLALVGFTVLIVIVVSMFPVPINKIKNWMATPQHPGNDSERLLPCSDLRVTDVWTATFPKLTSESSIRSVDVDGDGVLDVVFGFGTGDNSVLHPDIFCPIFMNVAPPCSGGVIALNGTNGNVIWKKHLAHTVFTIFCSVDLNSDGTFDCVVTGKGGIFVALNSKDGSVLWEFQDFGKDSNLLMDIYTVNFIPDQDGDNIDDIVAAHTIQKGRQRSGHVILISGKNGKEIQRVSTPNQSETYYIPQFFLQKDGQHQILVGTGSPSTPGNLTVIPLSQLISGNDSFQTIYQDKFKGVLSPAVLVDITGDGQLDIVAAMFNSTVVAIDGSNFQQLWNVTVNNSETLSIPTPGYFNDDNITDFLIKYQTGPEFPIYYYSQVFIIDGKTGKLIYEKPIVDSVGSQMAGLTLSMEGHGFDFFLFWMADCKFYEGRQDIYEFLVGSTLKQQSNSDLCKLRFGSQKVAKLYALNQFEQPPGLEIYNSDNRTLLEYNNTKSPIQEAGEYLHSHPEVQIKTDMQTPSLESEENVHVIEDSAPIKYKDVSPFRHKDNNQGLIKDYNKSDRTKVNNVEQPKFDPVDYDQSQDVWQTNYPKNYQSDDIDYNSYLDEPLALYTPNKKQLMNPSNRDPRNNKQKTSKKNLSDAIFSYKNVRQSKNRLLNDLNNVPTDILKETYFKNREQQLRKSRFEQRDLESHADRMRENEELRRVLEEEKKLPVNESDNLWTLESEKEIEERKNGYWRGKRDAKGMNISGIARISSVGVLLQSLDTTKNSVDLVFLTYWTPAKDGPRLLIEKDFQCIANKIKSALNSKEEFMNSERATLEESFKKECLEQRGVHPDSPTPNVNQHIKPNFPYFNQISQLSLGQMTVYRVRIECVCAIRYKGERCAKFLNPDTTSGWSEYLSKKGSGVFDRL